MTTIKKEFILATGNTEIEAVRNAKIERLSKKIIKNLERQKRKVTLTGEVVR